VDLARALPAAIVVAVSLAAPSFASAATTVGSPLSAAPEKAECGGSTDTNTALAAGVLQVPFAGVLVRWRLDLFEPGGAFTYRLRVLRPAGGSNYTGAGTGPPQLAPLSGVNIISLPSPIPVQPGDLIGVDCPHEAPAPFAVPATESKYAFFAGFLADGSTASPANQLTGEEELVNADVVGEPGVAAVSPSSGPSSGGTAVTISGTHLADVTSVTFGDAPASAVTPVSEGQVNVIAPAHPAGAVPVQATNAAGTSPVVAADTFTYQPQPGSLPPAPLSRPAVSDAKQSRAAWREGRGLPEISRRHKLPVGTTFSFKLNEAAAVSFTFEHLATGRKLGDRCVLKASTSAKHERCKRAAVAGTLRFSGHAGANTVVFEGRMSSSQRLRPGRYTLRIAAANSAGTAAPASLSFAVVS